MVHIKSLKTHGFRDTQHIKKEISLKKQCVKKMHIANADCPVTFYSFDMILAVGYRANLTKAAYIKIFRNENIAVNSPFCKRGGKRRLCLKHDGVFNSKRYKNEQFTL